MRMRIRAATIASSSMMSAVDSQPEISAEHSLGPDVMYIPDLQGMLPIHKIFDAFLASPDSVTDVLREAFPTCFALRYPSRELHGRTNLRTIIPAGLAVIKDSLEKKVKVIA